MRHLRRLLIALPVAVLFIVIVGISVTADAPPPGTGIDGLLPPPDIQHGNQPTFAEKYPPASYRVHVQGGAGATINALTNSGDEIGSIVGNLVAAMFTNAFVSIGVLTTRFVEWMFTFDLVSAIGGLVNAVAGSLAGTVYNGLIEAMIVITGGWLVYQFVRRRYTLLYEGMIWALVACCVAAVYFKSPADFVGGLNGVTTSVAQQTLAAVNANDPAMAGRGGDGTVAQGAASDAAVRIFVNRYWQTFVVLPWSVVQFGTPEAGQRYGEEWLKEENGQPNNFDSDFNATASQFTKDWFNGSSKYTPDRIGVAVLACIVSVLAALLLIPAAGMMLMAQVAQVALSMVAPLFLLVGVLPGYGRKLMTRWVELILGASLIRVFVATFLVVMMVIIGAASANAKLAYLMIAAIDIALLALFWMMRRPFMGVFGQAVHPEFGGKHYSGSALEHHGHRGLGWAHDTLQERLAGDGSGEQGALAGAGALGALGSAKPPALEAVLGAKKASNRQGGQAVAMAAAMGGGEAAAGASGVGMAALAALRMGQKGIRATRAARIGVQGTADPFIFGSGNSGNLHLRDVRAKELPRRGRQGSSAAAEPTVQANGSGPHHLALEEGAIPAGPSQPGPIEALDGANPSRRALPAGPIPAGPSRVPTRALPPSQEERWVTLVREGEDWNLYYSKGGELPMSKFPSREEAMKWADHEGWPVIEE